MSPGPSPHAAAIRILRSEIGRIRCCAGSHMTPPPKRERMLQECHDAEETIRLLEGIGQ